jgi:RNA polymerase sigma-70 factor (ECF subfamily)
MAAYVAGDVRAFEELFARLGPRVHGFFLRSFRDSSVADDLLQVTFMKLHRAREQYRRELKVAPWIFTVAARVRLDELRRRMRLPEDADEEALARADEAASAAADPGPASDVREVVRAALDRLPESQRTVIHLHRYEGMTFVEIAHVLGTTPGAVKLRAFRAYEKLRKELDGVLS